MAGGAAGAQFANPRSFLSITHLPLPESERSGEQLGLRLGQLVTPGGRESRTGLGGRRGGGAGLVVQTGEELSPAMGTPAILPPAGHLHLLCRPLVPLL